MILRCLILNSLLILANNPKWVQSACKFVGDLLACQFITIHEFYIEYFKYMWRFNTTRITKLEILDANIPRINRLYHLPDLGNLTSLKISGCGVVEIFEEDAFKDFVNIQVLDLSYNLLEEALFLEELPRSIFQLILNNNVIAYLDTDFSDWPNLTYIDLSHNFIKLIKLDNFRNVFHVDLSFNELYNLIPSEEKVSGYRPPSKLNLYHNDISMFYEKDSNLVLDWLDLGANRLKIVSLTFNKRFLGLSNSMVEQYIGEIETSVANLSNVQGLPNLKMIGKYLVLSQNKMENFGLNFSDIRRFYNYDYDLLDFLDLSNCSITNIPDMYFSYLIHCITLNLSYNSIDAIHKTVFESSKIDILDLSHSNIKELDAECFTNNTIEELRLNNNQISSLDNIFYNTSVEKLDMSNNKIVEITADSFKNLIDTVYLNLSSNLIQKIDPITISKMKSLDILDLTNNKFVNFDSNTFSYYTVKKLLLQGNIVSVVNKNAFDHLENLKSLNLSRNHIMNIRPKAFTNLSSIEEIDLSNNFITYVVSDIFYETPNLRKVDLSGNPIVQIFKISKSIMINELIITIDTILEPDEIDNFYLKILTIKDTNLEVLKADTFQGLYTLTELNFENTTVGHAEPGAFNSLFRLKSLDTKHLFNGVTLLPKETFKDLVQLEKMDLSEIGLTAMEEGTFNGLASLIHLNLSHNKFVQIVEGNFLGLPVLESLLLDFNLISNLEQGSFKELKKLRLLSLANNKLKRIPDGSFKHLLQLRNLNLQNNHLTELGKDSFQGLTSLIEIDLSNNRLIELPSGGLHHLKQLKTLRLPYNNISHLAVGSLSELKLLELLDLSHNSLSYFNTRTSFVNMKHLLILYLDYNVLETLDTNELLSKCRSLTTIGLSFNNFLCDNLATILLELEERDVHFKWSELGYDGDNIEGIQCVVDVESITKLEIETTTPEKNNVNDENTAESAITENNVKDENTADSAITENNVKDEITAESATTENNVTDENTADSAITENNVKDETVEPSKTETKNKSTSTVGSVYEEYFGTDDTVDIDDIGDYDGTDTKSILERL